MHQHHVIPRYRDPKSSVTVPVSINQHAMFHYCNWCLWGDRRDWMAWKGLSKQIGLEELLREKSAVGGRNNAGKPKSSDHCEKISKTLSQLYSAGLSSSLKERISHSMMGNTNSHSQKSNESRERHSKIMKEAWKRRKDKNS